MVASQLPAARTHWDALGNTGRHWETLLTTYWYRWGDGGRRKIFSVVLGERGRGK